MLHVFMAMQLLSILAWILVRDLTVYVWKIALYGSWIVDTFTDNYTVPTGDRMLPTHVHGLLKKKQRLSI